MYCKAIILPKREITTYNQQISNKLQNSKFNLQFEIV
jgi:hypothetical protein